MNKTTFNDLINLFPKASEKSLQEKVKEFHKDLLFLSRTKPLKKIQQKRRKILKKTGLILVNYNGLRYIRYLLTDLSNQTALPENVVIFDNNSSDGSLEYIKTFFRIKKSSQKKLLILDEEITYIIHQIDTIKIHILQSKKNLGGSGGFMIGLSYLKEYLKTEWVYTLDNDIRIPPNTFYSLYTLKDKKTFYTPTMLQSNNPEKLVECGAWIRPKFIFFDLYIISLNKNKKYVEFLLGNESKKKISVDYGALALSFFDLKNSNLNDKTLKVLKNFFIHWDDIYLCLYLKNKVGYRILALPQTYFWHKFSDFSITFGYRLYDWRNSIFLTKDFFPEYLTKIKTEFKKLAKIFLLQGKVSLVNQLIKAYNDGLKGKLGKINNPKVQFVQIENNKNNSVVLIERNHNNFFNINELIQKLGLDDCKNLILITRKKESIKTFFYNKKVIFWRNNSPFFLISLYLNLLKVKTVFVNFYDAPRIISFLPGKEIYYYEKRGDKYYVLKEQTSLKKLIKTYIKLLTF